MFLQSRNSHTCPLFKDSKIRKSVDKTALENCIFIRKSFKRLLRSAFARWFKFLSEPHSHDTKLANLGYLKIPSYRTKAHGRHSMIVNKIYVWNHLQSCHHNVMFHYLSTNKLTGILITFLISRYS